MLASASGHSAIPWLVSVTTYAHRSSSTPKQNEHVNLRQAEKVTSRALARAHLLIYFTEEAHIYVLLFIPLACEGGTQTNAPAIL